MYRLSKKLKALKLVLRALNKENYSSIHRRVERAKEQLLKLQNEFLTSPLQELVFGEQSQRALLADLLTAEESFLRQKFRIRWLREGDQNTSIFYKVVKGRNMQKKISLLYHICLRWTDN